MFIGPVPLDTEPLAAHCKVGLLFLGCKIRSVKRPSQFASAEQLAVLVRLMLGIDLPSEHELGTGVRAESIVQHTLRSAMFYELQNLRSKFLA